MPHKMNLDVQILLSHGIPIMCEGLLTLYYRFELCGSVLGKSKKYLILVRPYAPEAFPSKLKSDYGLLHTQKQLSPGFF